MSGAVKRWLTWLRGPLHPIASGSARDGRPLIACEACGCRLANPVDWSEVDDSRWWIRLRCGECAWTREVVVTDDAAQRLERDLEPGLREIAAAAAQLERRRMMREVDVFVAGLERDLIDADDFARWKR